MDSMGRVEAMVQTLYVALTWVKATAFAGQGRGRKALP